MRRVFRGAPLFYEMSKNEIEYTIKAKPTLYRGIEFRSRLEARWAAFFDLLGWEWEYEPCDFDGWYPDFMIFGSNGKIYIEVKPIIEFSINVAHRMAKSLPVLFDGEAILVGQRPILDNGNIGIGWCLFGGNFSSTEHGLLSHGDFFESLAVFGQWQNSNRIGICSDTYCFADMISGEYDGGCYGQVSFNYNRINDIWGMAHKAVRFEPKRKAAKWGMAHKDVRFEPKQKAAK